MSLLQQRVSSVSYLGISLSVCLSVYLSIHRSISVEQPPTPLFYDTSKPLTPDRQSVSQSSQKLSSQLRTHLQPVPVLRLLFQWWCRTLRSLVQWIKHSCQQHTHNDLNTAHIVNLSQHSKKVQIVRDLSLQLTMFGYTKCYHTSPKYASCVVF